MIKNKYLLLLTLMLLGMGGTTGAAAKMPVPDKTPWQEIPFNTIEGVRTGSVEDNQGKTGVTALLFNPGARGGIDISGGGPASRETPILNPLMADTPVNA